jgi:hypothetical protein
MENSAVALAKNNQTLNNLEFKISGRIDSVRHVNNTSFLQVTCPSKDSYSSPERFELKTAINIGQQGDNFSCTCRLSGFLKPFQYNDKQTGELKNGVNTKTFIEVIA